MPDEPVPHIVSWGRDPDRRGRAPRRLLVVVTAAVLIVGGIAFHIAQGSRGHRHHQARHAPPAVALAAPPMLHGTPLQGGGAPSASLFLGGEGLRLLSIRAHGPASLTDVLAGAGDAGTMLGPQPAVQQVMSAAGGVVALIDSYGSAGLPDIGDVLFIPAGASGAGTPHVIARANYMALAPDHRDIWVEQAGAPWGNGPADSPAWLVGEDGRRLSADRDLNGRALVAATVRGLLVKDAEQRLMLVDPSNGRAERAGIPEDAIIAGADADDVAWRAASCGSRCTLHVTDVRNGHGTGIALPPNVAIDPNDTSDFDPAGQRFALPLDTIGRHGATTGTYVYIADLRTRQLIRVPGGPIPVAALPAVLGAFPAGASDVVCTRWAAGGSGLWIVATDGLYFQAAYWTGAGPPRVLPPGAGLAYKLGVAGTGTPAA